MIGVPKFKTGHAIAPIWDSLSSQG